MNYITAMQRLAKYREAKRNNGHTVQPAYNFIGRLKQALTVADKFDKTNVHSLAKGLIEMHHNDPTPHLQEEISHGCDLLDTEYTPYLRRETAEYESRMQQIHRKATDELAKGNKKPGGGSALKAFAGTMLIIMAAAIFAVNMALDDVDVTFPALATLAMALLLLIPKKKPNEGTLVALANEAKQLTKSYYSKLITALEPAYADFEAKCTAALEAEALSVQAEVGERVFFLFENTPYAQQEYFMQLGMTATAEEDFNAIAQECLKADKSEQLVQLQNMVNRETRDSITKSLDKLNQTTRQMHEDAEFRARQQAAHNDQVAKQNQRALANQAKALDEMKKAQRKADDFEYHMRHK